jgi:tetratricopeptide (TPR) repeat protein
MYDDLGRKEEALKYYELALPIFVELGDTEKESTTLHNLGKVYYTLEKKEQALKCYKRALEICRKIGEQREEAITLRSIGILYFERRSYDAALASFLLSRNIFEEVQSSSDFQDVQAWIDALYDDEEVGEKQFITLLAQVEPQAHQIVEQALRQALE